MECTRGGFSSSATKRRYDRTGFPKKSHERASQLAADTCNCLAQDFAKFSLPKRKQTLCHAGNIIGEVQSRSLARKAMSRSHTEARTAQNLTIEQQDALLVRLTPPNNICTSRSGSAHKKLSQPMVTFSPAKRAMSINGWPARNHIIPVVVRQKRQHVTMVIHTFASTHSK